MGRRTPRRMRSAWASIALALTLVAAAASGGGPARADDTDRGGGFRDTERSALHDGRLVTRPREETRDGARFMGGTSFQVIDRPADEVWRALQDTAHYRHMFPQLEAAEVVAEDDSSTVVRFEHAAGPIHASYHLRLRFDEETRDISFDLDQERGGDLRAAHGFMTIRQYPRDEARTVLTWGLLADIGDGMLLDMVRGEIHRWMLRVPTTIRTYLHGRGRDLYHGEDEGRSS